METTLLKGGRVIDPANNLDGNYDILIENNIIKTVAPNISESEANKTYDCFNLLITPGLIDLHVHLREPGEEDKETIYSGSRAAAKGGFTSILPMANTKPTIDNKAFVKYITATADRDSIVNIYPVGAITRGLQGKELTEMGDMSAAGAVAFSDDGVSVMNSSLMLQAMKYSKMFNTPLILHEEDANLSGNGQVNSSLTAIKMGLAGIPKESEEIMVARDVTLALLSKAPTHFTHLSSPGSVDQVIAGKEKSPGITTCDTTPHHLTLTEESVKGYNTSAKMKPPLQTQEDVDKLVEHLKNGNIDCIVTDHAPHTSFSKSLEFENAPFGIIGLESAFAVLYTHLVKTDKVPLTRIIEALTIKPATIVNIPGGALSPGSPADISCFNLDTEKEFSVNDLESKSTNSPWLGKQLQGFAEKVFCNGELILNDGEIIK